ncbi:cation:proton antiporter domain-containing protein [Roseovarius salis]|uniref:cation:proton antiporter n=1 Tax=Roseovarius salis TaxID=3376063 RepID=UPI0037C7759B
MAGLPELLIALGLLFLAGLAADWIGARTRLPRVTLLLACGLVVGAPGLDLLPPAATVLYEFLSVTALTMVAFILGSALTRENLRKHGRAILSVSAMIVLATVGLVALGLWLIGVPAPAALLLGAIATATDPAATQDAIRQSGHEGPFADLIRGIVAIDDAWGLLTFSLVAVAAHGMNGGLELAHLARAGWEIGGALVLGGAIGLPASYLTGRLTPGEPLLTEALGIVFLTAGLAIWAEVSFLLAGMASGVVVANLARHHDRAFHEVEYIQWPFLLLFFILAGASLDTGQLAGAGLVGLVYIILRIGARCAGGWLGGRMAATPQAHRRWYGIALMPQAGVAVGMALVASQAFPEHAGLLLTVTVGTTIIFELLGPAGTLLAVRKAGQGDDPDDRPPSPER